MRSLLTVGFRAGLMRLDPFCSSPVTVWNDLKPRLLSTLRDERGRRADEAFCIKWFMRLQELRPLYESFAQTVQERYAGDVWARTMPAIRTAVSLPSMQALLTAASPSEHVTEDDFEAIKSVLLQDVRAALNRAEHHCANILREGATSGARESTSSGNCKSEDKGKGKAHDLSEKTVQTRIDIDDLFADEPAAADRALLERSTSLFQCAHPMCWQGPTNNYYVMTFLGLLQHDAMCHPSLSWDSIQAHPAADTTRALMSRLLDALGMPRCTALSAFHEQLRKEVPGWCSCGGAFDAPQPGLLDPLHSNIESLELMNLVRHKPFLLHVCGPPYTSVCLMWLFGMQLQHITGTSWYDYATVCVRVPPRFLFFHRPS